MTAQEYRDGFIAGEKRQFELGITYALAEVSRFLSGEHEDCLCSVCSIFKAHGWLVVEEEELTPVPDVFEQAFAPIMVDKCAVEDCPLPSTSDDVLCQSCLDSSDG